MESLLKTIIVDDESAARRALKRRLGQAGGFEILREAGTGLEAVELIRNLRPDLVFLDVQMPGMDGFDVLRALPRRLGTHIVFVTMVDDYAIRAFTTHGLDYLRKPFRDEHCTEVFRRLGRVREKTHITRHRQSLAGLLREITGVSAATARPGKGRDSGEPPDRASRRLAIRDGGRTTWVNQQDIEWIDAAGDYMCIHAGGETHILRRTMKSLEKDLDPSILQRIHRSTIVNVNQVKGMQPHINGEYFLTLKRGNTVKLSRSYRNKLRHFEQFRPNGPQASPPR